MRRFTLLPFVLLAVLTGAVACGGSGGGTTSDLPTISSGSSYGEKPTLDFPSGKPDGQLHDSVLSEGNGATVAKGDLLAIDYLGQIWNGKVFDNSYDRKAPLLSPIGVGQLISGWDKSLVGKKVGSRVMLVIPPSEGYGSQGQQQAGIKGTDTLVFVVDIINTYGPTSGSDPKATVAGQPPHGITVTGALGQEAKVNVKKGTKPPSKAQTIVLARGHGAKLKAGEIVLQLAATDWSGKPVQSTWTSGAPTSVQIGSPGQSSPLDSLVGLPIGSRVLLLVPPKDGKNAGKNSVAVVIDLVDQPPTAAEAAASS